MCGIAMNRPAGKIESKGALLLGALAGILAGLCCVTPIVLVLLGLATVAVAADIGNLLYGQWRWAFRLGALALLALALVVYFRKRGICTLDQAKQQRNRIINTAVIVLTVATTVYLLWTYVIVHYWGIAVGLPWAQYDESWAMPAALLTAASGALVAWALRRRHRHNIHNPPR
jgi:uncharacterized membrane protein YkvI